MTHDEFIAKQIALQDIAAQCLTDSERWFPNCSFDVPLHMLALCGEVGEAANIVKKHIREGRVNELPNNVKFLEELADSFIYLMNLFGLLQADPYLEYMKKRAVCEDRWGPNARRL